MTAIRYVPFAGRLLIGLPFAMSGLSCRACAVLSRHCSDIP